MKVDKMISEDEAALYDRQIRLWGVDAQKKLLSSRVLLVNMQGLGAEVAKNLVLSGINSLTLLDSNTVTSEDFKFNFLIPHSAEGNNRAEACVDALQTLNPMVKVFADKETLEQKNSDYFSDKNFDLVCMLSNSLQDMIRVDNYCRNNNVMFLSGFVFGLYGFMFVDFNSYNFIVEAPKISEDNFDKKKTQNSDGCATNSKTEEKQTFQERIVNFKSFENFLNDYPNLVQNLSANKLKRLSKTYLIFLLFRAFEEQHKRAFSPNSQEDKENLMSLKQSLFDTLKIDQEILSDSYLADKTFSEFSPVNAILGGVVAQEVIKAISKKNEPIENFFVFDGNVMGGEVIKV